MRAYAYILIVMHISHEYIFHFWSIRAGIPVEPTELTVQDISAVSANVSFTIAYIAITQETYMVMYGIDMDDLDMSSDTVNSLSDDATNQSYFVVLDNLAGATTYYYQVVSENVYSTSSSDTSSFTTLEGGIPLNCFIACSHNLYVHLIFCQLFWQCQVVHHSTFQ